jgi:hypothetical protein
MTALLYRSWLWISLTGWALPLVAVVAAVLR